MNDQTRLLDLSFAQLEKLMSDWGEPHFRARQIWSWMYQELVTDFEQMTSLPRALRRRLAAETRLNLLNPEVELVSSDGYTQKLLFQMADGQTIETVLMGYDTRRSVCISTQVGCAMACPFCATGQAGFSRNLTPGEIVAQVLYCARRLKQRQGPELTPGSHVERGVTNVVFMGMGEPMVNYDSVWQAIEKLTDPGGFGLGARHITVSTVGIVNGIEKFTRQHSQVNLAISLHAPNDELRNKLVPINKRFPIAQLLRACRDYQAATNRRVTFEYALMSGVNDSVENARELAGLLRGMIAHVNLIPLNPTAGSPLRPTPRQQIRRFRLELESRGIPCTVRIGRGLDINAGCGQLRETHARASDNQMPV